ncbi:hypothetical protein B0H11DRAFT_2255157 [Mycena galericulata]|nr:hypothetical protein B0H11DRAFT_2255157 [Mycena galericulata]
MSPKRSPEHCVEARDSADVLPPAVSEKSIKRYIGALKSFHVDLGYTADPFNSRVLEQYYGDEDYYPSSPFSPAAIIAPDPAPLIWLRLIRPGLPGTASLEYGELSGLWLNNQGTNWKSEQTVLLRIMLAITSESGAEN